MNEHDKALLLEAQDLSFHVADLFAFAKDVDFKKQGELVQKDLKTMAEVKKLVHKLRSELTPTAYEMFKYVVSNNVKYVEDDEKLKD